MTFTSTRSKTVKRRDQTTQIRTADGNQPLQHPNKHLKLSMIFQPKKWRGVHFWVAIRDWKRRGLFRQTTKDAFYARNSFFGVSFTAISPKVILLLVRIIITKVIFTRATFLHKESTFDIIQPLLGSSRNNFKVINVSTDVVEAVLIISHSHPNITTIT